MPKRKSKQSKIYSIKMYMHIMDGFVVIVLASQEGDTALRTIMTTFPEPTVGELVSQVLNQTLLKYFKNTVIKEGGFYFNDTLILISPLIPCEKCVINICGNKYTLIESSK